MVTLYHWDLPSDHCLKGRFLNPLFPDWFAAYAKVVFQTFGDRVKYWTTFNEPSNGCSIFYPLSDGSQICWRPTLRSTTSTKNCFSSNNQEKSVSRYSLSGCNQRPRVQPIFQLLKEWGNSVWVGSLTLFSVRKAIILRRWSKRSGTCGFCPSCLLLLFKKCLT